LLASVVGLGFLSIAPVGPPADTAPAEGSVPFTVVRGIVDLRCGSCHARTPSDKAYLIAPSGVSFGTDKEIAARAAMIKASTSITRTMPPGNATRMTDEERTLIARWADQGGHID
jgi:uncharacterized membrane protein